MKLLNFVIIKLTLSLIAGIVIAAKFDVPFSLALLLTVIIVSLLGFLWFVKRKRVSKTPYFGLLSILVFIALGMLTFSSNDPRLNEEHYVNLNSKFTQKHQLVFTITERLKRNLYNDRYIANVLEINDRKSNGRLLINIPIDSTITPFNVDQSIVTYGNITEIKTPLNPFQFNYAEYLSNKYIYGQVMLNENNYYKLPHQTNSILGLADTIRTTINNRLLSNGINGDPLAIINALLLGQRQDIDDTIYNNYVNAGVIHILAVSGLHVGLLLIILNYLLKPLLYFKHGKIIKLVLLILFLWSFAVIAGLSASVTRAVAMFSIVTIAYFYRRATNIYNTLAISAFFILLIKPSFLFEVGFQLSYLAVIAIVSIQPLIYRLWRPKQKLLDRLWQIFSVTLAAQFGVVPISLYYFHQFPGLFFVSNLVIIPLLGIILGLGLFVILLALLNILHPIIALVFSSIINYLNNFISWIASFETFLLQDLSFGLVQMVSAYAVIIAFTYFAKTKSFRGAVASLLCVVFLQSASMYYKIANSNDELVIFNKSRSSILLRKQNDHITLYSDLDDTIVERLKPVRDYMVGSFVSTSEAKPLKNVYTINSKVVLVVDSMGIYNTESFKPDFVLLRNSPKINMNRLLTELNPKLVIADASNYRTYVQRWKATCTKQKIPFHYTYEKGAFIYP